MRSAGQASGRRNSDRYPGVRKRMFTPDKADIVKSDGQTVPARSSNALSAHDVGVGAHAHRAVPTALFQERHIDGQRRAWLDPMRIQEKGAARADVDGTKSEWIRAGLAGNAANRE
jgi:hypothetical protein